MSRTRVKTKKTHSFNLRLALIIFGAGLILFSFTYKPLYTFLTKINLAGSSQLSNNEPIKVDSKLFAKRNKEEFIPQRVLVPNLGVDVEVKPAKIISGVWEVFPDTASFGLGSAVPGETGNTVIFAHARKGLFLPLEKITNGTKIYVMTPKNWFSYKVTEIKKVSPNDISIIEPTLDETLTLYTCSGFADSLRLIVIAKRI
jgi:sortase (surface protein transpeptidase)